MKNLNAKNNQKNKPEEQILPAKVGTNYGLTEKKQIMVVLRMPEQFSCTYTRLMSWKWFH